MLSKVHPVSVALRLEMLADSPLAFLKDWTVGRDRLGAGVMEGNDRAIRVSRKLGFTPPATATRR